MDPRALPGSPDQPEDRERAVGLGVQHVADRPVGVTAALAGGQDGPVGEVRAEPVGDEVRGAGPVGAHGDRLPHRRDEVSEHGYGRGGHDCRPGCVSTKIGPDQAPPSGSYQRTLPVMAFLLRKRVVVQSSVGSANSFV